MKKKQDKKSEASSDVIELKIWKNSAKYLDRVSKHSTLENSALFPLSCHDASS
jgi:hemerythrin-like domain-containing protein